VAGIDQDVRSLLSSLVETPLAAFGELVLARLRDEEAIREGRRGDPEQDLARTVRRRQALVGETPRRRAVRQLDLAHSVITEHLKRQLLISKRLRELVRELGLTSLRIAPPPRDSEIAATASGVDLLSERREQAIERFLQAWNGAQVELRQRRERRDAG
jgi:hypothetical protein